MYKETLLQPTEHPRKWRSWEEGLGAAAEIVASTLQQMIESLSSRVLLDERDRFAVENEFKSNLWELPHQLLDRKDPVVMMSFFIEQIEKLHPPVGDDSYSFVHNETERQSTIAEARAVRRSNIASAKYIWLREWKNYINSLRLIEPDAVWQGYCDRWFEIIEQTAKQIFVEECGIENIDAVCGIQRSGELIDRQGDAPITEQQLVFVRVQRSHLPEVADGTLQLVTPFAAGVGNRNSIHGALNHYVESHSKGSWHDVSSVIIAPMAELSSQFPPTSLNEIDTFFYGKGRLTLPDNSVLVIKGGDARWEQLLARFPEIAERYTVLRVSDSQAIRAAVTLAMLRMGYSIIPGGDYGSADKKIQKKVSALAKQRQITEGSIVHFYSLADTLDLMHSVIVLGRVKKKHGLRWVEQIDWDGKDVAIRSQLAELMNSVRPFLANVVDIDFKKYNLPDTRKAELLAAAIDLMQDQTSEIKIPNQDKTEQQRAWTNVLATIKGFSRGILNRYATLTQKQKETIRKISPEAYDFFERHSNR